MANLAIKGHATRGNEVIEILEMLGGINKHNYHNDSFSLCHLCFCIAKNTNIIYFDWVRDCCEDEDILVFTLEKFLKKFPYKVGDKVYNIVHNENQTITNLIWDPQENEIVYQTDSNDYVYVNYLQPYKEKMEEKDIIKPVTEINLNHPEFGGCNEIELIIPEGWKFEQRDNKMFGIRKQPQYPKTYIECAKILDCFSAFYIDGYKNELIENLQELLICRDAYWKIAGEQMGLGKPWELPFNENQDSDPIYFIVNKLGKIYKDNANIIISNRILAFPTVEMRDTFYENFKELIELCKKLL